MNPRLRKDQVAKELGCSSNTLQRYRQDINMPSAHRIPPIFTKSKQKSSNREHDFKRRQKTSNYFKRPELTSNVPVVKFVKSKNKLKGGGSIETEDICLDEILPKNNLQTDLTKQTISDNKTVRSDTVKDIREFNSKSLAIQAKTKEKLVCMIPANGKAFDLMGDDIVQSSTEMIF